MGSRGNNHNRRGRWAAAGAAVTAVTTALGLAVGSAAPAYAAGSWNPDDHALPWLPTTAVDGEITVTRVGADDRGAMKSFRRDGTAVTYANTSGAREHVWGPAGDVVSARVIGTDPTFTVTELNSPKEYLTYRSTSTPVQWSPFGDSLVKNPGLSSGGQQVATWTGSGRSEVLTTGTAKDTAAAAPLADGFGALMTIPSPTVPGKRDLGLVEAEFPRYGNLALNAPAGAPEPLGYGALDARLPATAPDGTLAFVGTGDKGVALFVDEGQGPVAVRSLGADCPGQRPSFAPSARAIAVLVANPDCASTELHVIDKGNGSFVGGTDTLVTASGAGTHFESASWRPLTPLAHTERISGRDRIATAIATSAWGWQEGSQGAVLASSSSFADGVVAGPLSAQSGMPLLLNGATTLDSRVLTELKRLMKDPADRFVAIVGGTGVIGTGVEKALRNNGFAVQRISGTDRFATSVAVARELDAGWQGQPVSRTSAFLADGMNFPDALSAGPAASVFFAPVLLTKGSTVPASVASYVNGRSAIKNVYGIGGNAASASTSFTAKPGRYQVFGQDRYETSTKVAQTFFPGGSYVGYASGQAFPDALAGGALMGAMAEPLLLVAGSTLPAVVRAQADRYRAGTDLVLVFGGTGVVSDAVKTTVSSLAGKQTAIWGWNTPSEENPDFPATLAARTHGSQTPVGGTRDGNIRPEGPAQGGFRSAAER